MASSWMAELNAAQRAAATHGDGPVLVIAGAGTGKTKTLACRVAHLIERGVKPERILLLTFTRRAAAEMLTRAARLTAAGSGGGAGIATKVWGGTFHAIANRLLRQHGRALGLAPQFTVMDQGDAADLMSLIRSELGLAKTDRRFPRKGTLASIYSRVVNSRTKLAEVVERHYPWCKDDLEGIRQIFEQFTARKRAQNVLDYDDLLLYWHALLNLPGEGAKTGEKIAEQFDHVLVDEYQDTNLVQAEILQALRRKNQNIMVVGDDAQSIYSFRAATVRNILDFPKQFPGAAVVKLEQNYRSVQPILDASNELMARAAPETHQFAKNLISTRTSTQKPELVTCMDEPAQCEAVCARVLGALERGIALKRQAVLFRAAHHSDQLEVELTRRNIPFVKYGGLKFVEAAHIKDVLAILRLMENPTDEVSWFRVLLLLDGVGPASARRMIAEMGGGRGAGGVAELQGQSELPHDEVEEEGREWNTEGGGLPTPSPGRNTGHPLPGGEGQRAGIVIGRVIARPPGVPVAGRKEFAALLGAFADCVQGDEQQAHLGPAAQVERVRRFFDPVVRRVYENPDARLRDLDQLEQIAGNYKSRGQFITDLTLDAPSRAQDLAGPPLLEEDYLILSTIHSAKGCEWESVHVIHAADGMIPSDMATGSPEEIDEERRLLYVAMTRAKDRLHIHFPLRYYFGRRRSDRHSYAQLTRFIPPGAMRLYERSSVGVEETVAEPMAGQPAAMKGIDAMLNQLWR